MAWEHGPTAKQTTGFDMANLHGMTPNALAAWDRLNGAWGKPLSVNSAYRDPEHNRKVGGAKNSQHTHGNAFDVDVSSLSPDQRQELVRQARASGFNGIGVYQNALHFDTAGRRAWGPSYGRNSLPDEYAWLLDDAEAPQERAQEPQQAPQRPDIPQRPPNALTLAYRGHDARDFMTNRRFT